MICIPKSTNYLISCKVRFYQGYQLFCNRVYFPPSPVSTHQAELYVDCYLLSLSARVHATDKIRSAGVNTTQFG